MWNLNSKNIFRIMREMQKKQCANANGANQTFSTLMRSETKTFVHLFILHFCVLCRALWLFHPSFLAHRSSATDSFPSSVPSSMETARSRNLADITRALAWFRHRYRMRRLRRDAPLDVEAKWC